MRSVLYCEECAKEVQTSMFEKKEKYNFKGEQFEVVVNVVSCSQCLNELPNEYIDGITMQQLTDMYLQRIGKIDPIQQNRNMKPKKHHVVHLLKPFYPSGRTINSGFRDLSINKFIQMILFFTKTGVNKTVLLKLLFYSDFLYFKRTSLSISGFTYVKYPHGPVPQHFNILLHTLERCGYISIKEEKSTEYVRIVISSVTSAMLESFEEAEQVTLVDVHNYFAGYSSRKISYFSHQELAWKEPNLNETISYKYAKTLQIE